jgi:CBS domain containing-hemolysin-like protein
MAATLAFLLAFALLTFMHVVLGELVPKALALSRREQIALRVARPLHLFSLAFGPFVWLLDAVATLLTRPFGISRRRRSDGGTEEDVRLLVAAEEVGVIRRRRRRCCTRSSTSPTRRCGR